MASSILRSAALSHAFFPPPFMEKHIKERLVGAIVLVAIVVIVVPELLTGPREAPPAPPPSEPTAPVRTVTIDLATGSQRDAAAADRIGEPLPEATVPGADGAIDRAPPTAAGEAPSSGSGAAGPDASATPAAGSPSAAPPPKSPATASPGADASTPKPSAAAPPPGAVPADVKPPSTATPGPARPTLVETKPAAGTKPGSDAGSGADAKPRADAKPAAESKGSSDAAKPAAPPTAPPRPAAPSASAAEGWVVQLGSFASRPNAERLVAELRAKGYAGFVSEFRGSGRVLYRVRVGPEQDRARAEAIAQRLARDGKKGTVAPHP